MAGRLGVLARRAAAPRALLPVRGGGGGPVASGRPPTEPVSLLLKLEFMESLGEIWQESNVLATLLLCCDMTGSAYSLKSTVLRKQSAMVLFPQSSKSYSVFQLAEEDELVWDDGSARPEPCLDDFPLFSTVGL